MGWRSGVALATVMLAAAGTHALVQSPTYGLGRTPTAEEIRAQDISIRPDGKGLPPGRGTAKEGAAVYKQKCAACHGPDGRGGAARRLVSPKGEELKREGRTLANYWPFATLVYDFINRAMPFRQNGTLKPDEVYALTAYLLYRSDIIREDEALDMTSLPKVQMPNREAFDAPPLADWKVGGPRPFK